MRALLVVATFVCSTLMAWSADAQSVDALKQELEDMRERFQRAQQEYQKALDVMSERLRRLEASPPSPSVSTPVGAPGVAAPPASPPPIAQTAPAPGARPWPSLMEMARPREPFALASERGPGALVFDIGVAGDFVANLVQDRVDRTDSGTFRGRENRFFVRELELNLFGQIDSYARGEVRLATREFAAGLDVDVLAEGHLTLLSLPFGTQVKMGKVRNRFGLLNERHDHDLPQTDRPNALVAFFGEEGLVENGFEATIVPPLPFRLEALVGVFNGDNDVAFGRQSLKDPLVTARLRTSFAWDSIALQFGLSGASGATAKPSFGSFDVESRRNTIAGADVVYKYTPEGWRHPLLTVAGEALVAFGRRFEDVSDFVVTEEKRTGRRYGWYAFIEAQPWQQWLGGVRYDWTQAPVGRGGVEWAVEPYLAFSPSDFLRFRLAYKHTDRSPRFGFTDVFGAQTLLDEVLFQASFVLGAHPARPF